MLNWIFLNRTFWILTVCKQKYWTTDKGENTIFIHQKPTQLKIYITKEKKRWSVVGTKLPDEPLRWNFNWRIPTRDSI